MRRSVTWTLVTLVTLLVLSCAGFFLPIDLAVALGAGWAFYLARVLPEVTVDRAGVATGAVCLVLLAVGSHAFLRWLYEPGRAPGRRWKPRWTASMVAMVVLMFVAGLSATGVVHQLGWLMDSGPVVVGGGASQAVRRAQSRNNLRQIGIGLDAYQQALGSYPPGGTFDAIGRPQHGWMAEMLPFVDRQPLHDAIDFGLPWDHPRNRSAFRTEITPFLNPGFLEHREDPEGYALAHYAGNALLLGGDVPGLPSEVTDGLSHTILAGEVPDRFEPWGSPTNWRDPALGINRAPEGFGGPSPGGANILFGDGSVRFIRETIDPAVLRSLGTPAGGEPIPPDLD